MKLHQILTLGTQEMRRTSGFALLELIIVLFLISLILGLSTIYFANFLPSHGFNSIVRDMSSTVRYARSLSQIHGEIQTVSIDLDSKTYGIEGRNMKTLPDDISIKLVDPISGEISEGKYNFIFYPTGGIESGTIVLWNSKKSVTIQLDPIVGSVMIK
jgi:hypothetical protein